MEGKIFADEIEAVDSIVGESGSMVLTDGRDPALFEGPDDSLSLAFQDGVYVTGGGDLHVEGKIFADEIEAVDSIVGESGSMVLTDGRDPALFEGPDESLSLAYEDGVIVTGSNLYVEKTGYFEDIVLSKSTLGNLSVKKHYETINANFWWSDYNTGVYIPLNHAEHFHIGRKDGMGENAVASGMNIHHVKLMNSPGRIKKINFSITKTNPYGLSDVQFNIISGKAIDFNCNDKIESENNVVFINEIGSEYTGVVERTNYQFPEWEDAFNIYKYRTQGMDTLYPCCYPLDPYTTTDGSSITPAVGKLVVFLTDSNNFPIGTEGRIKSITTDPTHGLTYEIKNQTTAHTKLFRVNTVHEHSRGFRWEMKGSPIAAETYRTPQKYVNYSYEFIEEKHFEEGTYIAISMDKGGLSGIECNKGDIDQAIFVSVLLEQDIS